MSNKNIIVVGGTGLIGNSVLGYLSKKKPKIFALTRNKIPNKPENVEEVFFDFDTLESINEIKDWDHIYICLGRKLKVWELIYIRKKDRENHFVAIWNNRNARRKRPSDLLESWRNFLDKTDKEMATTWSVVVRKEDDDNPVRLYCPDCWNTAQEVINNFLNTMEEKDES